jgi:hypothetical protein
MFEFSICPSFNSQSNVLCYPYWIASKLFELLSELNYRSPFNGFRNISLNRFFEYHEDYWLCIELRSLWFKINYYWKASVTSDSINTLYKLTPFSLTLYDINTISQLLNKDLNEYLSMAGLRTENQSLSFYQRK